MEKFFGAYLRNIDWIVIYLWLLSGNIENGKIYIRSRNNNGINWDNSIQMKIALINLILAYF